MKILAIETSCDETGAAIVKGEKTADGFSFETLGAALLSQAALHSEYGGVYPNLAKREHQKNLPLMLERALADAHMQAPADVDGIAVTQGPGLEPALWTGITFAQKLSKEWNLPLLPANHMEGHLVSSLAHHGKIERVRLPVLALLVSGGHTEFIVMREWFNYQMVGETLDDAVGECFDKVARMLLLPYPGGPHISRLARHARETGAPVSRATLPRPMLNSGTCDVSFSGLKTAALYALRDLGGAESLTEEEKAAFAREFEDAVAEVFVSKTRRALEQTSAQTFVIGGGVAANAHLRGALAHLLGREFPDVIVRMPEPSMTGDNAVMIAQAALARALSGVQEKSADELRAIGNLSLAAR